MQVHAWPSLACSPSRRYVRGATVIAIASLMILALPHASAHEPKEYTVLLKHDGPTPNGISPGILVSSDSLFFYNVDLILTLQNFNWIPIEST